MKPALSLPWDANPVTHIWPHYGNLVLAAITMRAARPRPPLHNSPFSLPNSYVL